MDHRSDFRKSQRRQHPATTITMDSNTITPKKVTVMTAGGAGGGGGSKNRKNSKKGPSSSSTTTKKRTSSSTSSSAKAAATAAATAAAMTTTNEQQRQRQQQAQNSRSPPSNIETLELEHSDHAPYTDDDGGDDNGGERRPYSDHPMTLLSSGGQHGRRSPTTTTTLQLSPSGGSHHTNTSGDGTGTGTGTAAFKPKYHELVWLFICFFGIMASFVCYGLLLEYATSNGRHLHELSFLFVTSGLYTMTAAAGRYVRDETPTTIPPARFAILGLTSMGSTFFSVRSLRYVIYPIQVLAKSCKPVPVMIMGAFMGKKYPLRKYINVCLIVLGVALFMGGGDKKKKGGVGDGDDDMSTSPSQLIGILLLFISLCFDGGTGAYEDKLMSVHSVQPFDLMYNIQLGKTILAGIGLLVLNQMHLFIQMCQDMGFLLLALGLSGALGQVFIFVTIAKFGALTCSIIGLSRKVTTLVFSIYFYGHHLNGIQFTGLLLSITAMVLNFVGKKKGGGGGHGHGGGGGSDDKKSATLTSTTAKDDVPEEMQKMLADDDEVDEEQPPQEPDDDIELATTTTTTPTKGSSGVVLTAGGSKKN